MKSDKKIEKITNQLLSEIPLESPSPEFVDRVMKKVHAIAEGKAAAYQPLISKKGWIIVLLCIAGGLIYAILNPLALDVTLEWLNFSFIENYQLPAMFERFQLPDFFGITFVFFSVLVIFQMFFLNKYFRRNIYG